METEDILKEQVNWIKTGKTGCAYATTLINQRDLIGWEFQIIQDIENDVFKIPEDAFMLSIIFPNQSIESIRTWALKNGFFIENVNEIYEGLRIEIDSKKAWIFYFGQDSHLPTRQSPHPMLTFSVRIPAIYHVKVLLKGILSVAHASLQFVSDKQNEVLWKQSHIMTKRILGYSPNKHDAMTTFKKCTNGNS